jgi:hypothetical protein
MIEHEATRTLVKSSPEIWAQCSEAESLGRHLNGSFGEIRITRLEPEHAVAWEGEAVSGTVRIEPSAWGTRVTMSVQTPQETVQSESVAVAEAVQSESVAGPEEVQPVAPPAPPVLEAEPETAAPQPIPSLDSSSPQTSSTTFLARLRARFRRWATGPGPEAKDPEPRPAEPTVEAPEVTSPVASEPDAPEVTESEALPAAASEPEAPPQASEPPFSTPDSQTAAVTEALNAALESLGQAHHRPYSRA